MTAFVSMLYTTFESACLPPSYVFVDIKTTRSIRCVRILFIFSVLMVQLSFNTWQVRLYCYYPHCARTLGTVIEIIQSNARATWLFRNFTSSQSLLNKHRLNMVVLNRNISFSGYVAMNWSIAFGKKGLKLLDKLKQDIFNQKKLMSLDMNMHHVRATNRESY